MKIQNINNMDPGMRKLTGPEQADGASDKPVVFTRTLTDVTQQQYSQRISELIGKIDDQGKKLSKRADIKEFERYRSLIRDFMDEVVSNSFEFTKENNYAGRGRHRVFATVKTIDAKLDALAKEVLSEQADSIEIVHQIDDIRGLLLDMLL